MNKTTRRRAEAALERARTALDKAEDAAGKLENVLAEFHTLQPDLLDAGVRRSYVKGVARTLRAAFAEALKVEHRARKAERAALAEVRS